MDTVEWQARLLRSEPATGYWKLVHSQSLSNLSAHFAKKWSTDQQITFKGVYSHPVVLKWKYVIGTTPLLGQGMFHWKQEINRVILTSCLVSLTILTQLDFTFYWHVVWESVSSWIKSCSLTSTLKAHQLIVIKPTSLQANQFGNYDPPQKSNN